jgi:hypothetical protein
MKMFVIAMYWYPNVAIYIQTEWSIFGVDSPYVMNREASTPNIEHSVCMYMLYMYPMLF